MPNSDKKSKEDSTIFQSAANAVHAIRKRISPNPRPSRVNPPRGAKSNHKIITMSQPQDPTTHPENGPPSIPMPTSKTQELSTIPTHAEAQANCLPVSSAPCHAVPSSNMLQIDTPKTSHQTRISEDGYTSVDDLLPLTEEINKLQFDLKYSIELADPSSSQHQNYLLRQIIDKTNTLVNHITLNSLGPQMNPTLLMITSHTDQLRKALPAATSHSGRPRSTSEDPNSLNLRRCSASGFKSRYAQRLAENQLPSHSQGHEEVFLNDQGSYNHNISAQDETEAVTQLIHHIGNIEADILNNSQTDRFEIEQNTENIQNMEQEIGNVQQQVDSIEVSCENSITLIETRVTNIEKTMNTLANSIKELTNTMKTETSNLKSEIEDLKNNKQTLPDQSLLGKLITDSVNPIRKEIYKDIEGSFISKGLINPTERDTLHDKLKGFGDKLASHELQIQALGSTANVTKRSLKELHLKASLNIPTPIKKSTANNTPIKEPTPNAISSASDTDLTTQGYEFSKQNLLKLISTLNKDLAAHPLNDNSDPSDIRTYHLVARPRIQNTRNNIQTQFQNLLKSTRPIDKIMHDETIKAMDCADQWFEDIGHKFEQVDIPPLELVKDKILPKVTVFAGDHKKTVYEFFAEFEAVYSSLPAQRRAHILRDQFLSESLKSQTSSFINDYSALKASLVKNFGEEIYMVSSIISALSQQKKPKPLDHSERGKYFSSILATMTRIFEMKLDKNIKYTKINEYLESFLTLKMLTDTLPESDEIRFIDQCRSIGLNTQQLQGPHALAIFKTFLEQSVEDATRAANKESALKQQLVHNALTLNTQTNSSPIPTSNPPSSLLASSTPQTNWWTNGLKFPCPVGEHSHEIGSCSEYLQMPPKERCNIGKTNPTRTVCFLCMKPLIVCKRKCATNKAIPDELKCTLCLSAAKKQNQPTRNVLYCCNKGHDQAKPTPEVLFNALTKYLTGSQIAIPPQSIICVNHGFVSMTITNSPQSPPVKEIFDTKTGNKVELESPINPVAPIGRCFLMQWINIGTSQCLLMFDRGSNTHLIDGSLAETESLDIIYNQPSWVNGIGGKGMSTNYGQYALPLGSKNNPHILVCHGINQISVKFNEIELQTINAELRQSAILSNPNMPLPSKLGGSSVSLLVGLTDVSLDPVLIGTLSSGLGVYRSPFTDIYGSNICYGGPHPTFDPPHGESSNHMNVSLFLAQTRLQAAHIPHLHDALSLNNEDQKTCLTCLKAIIPISKMRELVDQDDMHDTMMTRCPECSKCQSCKRSNKAAASSIQDSIEQLAIEKSVHLDLEKEEVWVDLPFTQNPNEFLIKKHHGSSNYFQALRPERHHMLDKELELNKLS